MEKIVLHATIFLKFIHDNYLPMKKHSKKIMAVSIAAFVFIAGAGIATSFAAQGPIMFSDRISNGVVYLQEGRESLIQAIAEKFNLNTEEVKTVFDEHQKEMLAERGQYFTVQVNKEVTSGELTQAQADAILAKRTELIEFTKTLEGKAPEEIQEAMKIQMESLKAWAQENDINLKDLRGLHLGVGPFMMKHHEKAMHGFPPGVTFQE